LTVVLTNRISGIAGSVTDARGHAVTDYTVIVCATRADRWYQGSRFFTFTRPKVDGTFAVTDLPSGEYYVAAVDWLQGTEGLWRVAGPGVPGIDRAAGHARDPGRRAGGGSHGATHHSLNLVPSDLQKISFSDS